MTLLLEEVYKLQILDSDILSTAKLLSEVKFKISDNKEINSLEESININSINLKKLQIMKSKLELEINSTQQNVYLLNKKIYGGSIKNSKELIALDSEKIFLEGNISDNEDKLLKVMMKTDITEDNIEKLNNKITHLKNNKEIELPKLKYQEKELSNKIIDLKSDRKRIVPNIRQDILMIYNQLLKSKEGLAVVKVTRGTCGGCRLSIPSADLQRARNASTIVRCSSCNRIIFSDS